MNRPAVGIAALAVMTVALVGCDGGGEEVPSGVIEVRGLDFSFDPSEVTIQAGEEVTILFRNAASPRSLHNWVVLDVEEPVFTGKVLGGEEEAVTFTIDEPGTYTVICDVTGHREAGMEGTLIVE